MDLVKKIQLFSLIVIAAIVVEPQTALGQKTWFQFYPAGSNNTYLDFEPTQNGGLVAVGTKPIDSNTTSGGVERLGRDGDVIWSWFPSPNTQSVFTEVEKTSNGFIVFAHITDSTDNPTTDEALVAELDANGNVIWQDRQATFKEDPWTWKDVYGAVSSKSNQYLLAGDNASGSSVRLLFYNTSGNVVNQTQVKIKNFKTSVSNITALPDSGYLMSGEIHCDDPVNLRCDSAYITRLSEQGNQVWTKVFSTLSGTKVIANSVNHAYTKYGNIIIAGHTETGVINPNTETFFYKVNATGKVLWKKTFNNLTATDVDVTKGGNYVIAGHAESKATALMKTDTSGNSLWTRTYNQNIFQPFEDQDFPQLAVTDNNHLITSGGKNLSNNFQKYILKTDSTGQFLRNRIVGNLYLDTDSNCERTSNDIGLSNKFIIADGGQTLYQYTDSAGRFAINTSIDTFRVTYKLPNSNFDISSCVPDTQVVAFDNTLQVDTVNFPLKATMNCPSLTVDLSAPFLRCSGTTYTVQYCNEGTVKPDSAYIEVQFDPHLTIDSSSIPWETPQSGNFYRFNIDNPSILECGSFKVHGSVDCANTELDQTLCSEAHIFPDSLCQPDTSGWNEAEVEVEANCINNDTVQFLIENVGKGDIQSPLRYYIVEDNVMLRSPTFQLKSGEDTVDVLTANGSTFRIEAEQAPNFPIESEPADWVEGCGGFGTKGVVTQYHENDAARFVSVDCQPNVGPFDPNDKQVTPKGRGMSGTVNQNRDLEYKIRFQNVGSDTAFRVVLLDTLSPHLDISSIQLGASSHNYQFQIRSGRVMEWEFPNIELPDSNVNEPASHGFVKFRVEQQDDLPIGTEIRNRAAIFFDFNDPVLTNQTLNTIGEDFRKIVHVEEKGEKIEKIDVYPNPFRDHVTFELKGQRYNELHLRIYNIQGQQVRSYGFHNTNRLRLEDLQLQKGAYLFEITSQDAKVGEGKFLVR